MKRFKYDDNFIFVGEVFLQKNPIEGGFFEQSNTTRIEPPFFSDDEYLKLKSDRWVVIKKTKKGLYFDKKNGEHIIIDSDYEDISHLTSVRPNITHDEINKIEFKNGSWFYKNPSFDQLSAKKLDELKNECNKRIRSFNNKTYSSIDWLQKSQNYQDIKHQYLNNLVIKKAGGIISDDMLIKEKDYIKAKEILDRKDKFIKKYSEIESNIENMAGEELINFDPKNDMIWDGL